MARKRKPLDRPLINIMMILFFGLALYDTGGMVSRTISEEKIHAMYAGLYFIAALISLIGLLLNQRKIWLWILVTALLGAGLAYLISIIAKAWIIGIGVMIFFWLKTNNRRWHQLPF